MTSILKSCSTISIFLLLIFITIPRAKTGEISLEQISLKFSSDIETTKLQFNLIGQFIEQERLKDNYSESLIRNLMILRGSISFFLEAIQRTSGQSFEISLSDLIDLNYDLTSLNKSIFHSTESREQFDSYMTSSLFQKTLNILSLDPFVRNSQSGGEGLKVRYTRFLDKSQDFFNFTKEYNEISYLLGSIRHFKTFLHYRSNFTRLASIYVLEAHKIAHSHLSQNRKAYQTIKSLMNWVVRLKDFQNQFIAILNKELSLNTDPLSLLFNSIHIDQSGNSTLTWAFNQKTASILQITSGCEEMSLILSPLNAILTKSLATRDNCRLKVEINSDFMISCSVFQNQAKKDSCKAIANP